MASFQKAVNGLCSTIPPGKDITDDFLKQIKLKGVQLRPYQTKGLQWLIQRHSSRLTGCVLGDDMGLGKTLQTVSFLLYLHSACRDGLLSLVVCPLSVTAQWKAELEKIAPDLSVCVYTQGKEERVEKQRDLGSTPCNVILTTYEIVLKDSTFLHQFSWSIVVVDEAHHLKNSSSKLHETLTDFNAGFRLLLTGTPMQNSMDELYSLLCFVCPSTFPIRNMDLFCAYYRDTANEEVVKRLHELLKPLLLRRTRNEVLGDLPEKSDLLLFCGMTQLQREQYKALLMKDTSAFSGSGSRTSLMNILMNLRKCANHPYLFNGVEPEPFELGDHLIESSGKLFVIDKLLDHLKVNGHRVLLFSQMTRMLDIIQDYLGYRGYSYERLDGSVRGEERFVALQNFQKDEHTFVFLLSTKAGGVGLNLVGADTVVFVDSDFNPQNDLQAAARAHRIGQTRAVKVIRLVARNTVDEVIIKRAAAKLELTNRVIESGQFSGLSGGSGSGPPGGRCSEEKTSVSDLVEMLKFGLGSLLQSSDDGQNEVVFEDILGRSENGQWLDAETSQHKETNRSEKQFDDNIYMYEGQDYSKISSEADKKAFDELLVLEDEIAGATLEQRVLRRENKGVVQFEIPVATRKRRTWTPEELAERRKKREEAKAKKMKLMEEEKQRKAEERLKRKLELWEESGYCSANIGAESDGEEDEFEEEEEEKEGCDLGYLRGDVTHPQCLGDEDALILHCVDNSGHWGRGGVFSALLARSTAPKLQYELAHKMKDLHLGDAHIVPVDDRESREHGHDYAVLIVAQSRNNEGRLSGIQLSALDIALKKIAKAAIDKKGAQE